MSFVADNIQDAYLTNCQFFAKYAMERWREREGCESEEDALAQNILEQMLSELKFSPESMGESPETKIIGSTLYLATLGFRDECGDHEEYRIMAGAAIQEHRDELLKLARPFIRRHLKAEA